MRRFCAARSLLALVCLVCVLPSSRGQVSTELQIPTIAASTAPTTAESPQAIISPQAKELLGKIDRSYKRVPRLDMAGTIKGDFDVAGMKRAESAEFTATFAAPRQFKHTTVGDVTLGCTGAKTFIFQPSRNAYLLSDLPSPASLADWPSQMVDLLSSQNPALLLALLASPSEAIGQWASAVDRVDDTTLNGVAYPTLQLSFHEDPKIVKLLFDNGTGLPHSAMYDLAPSLRQRGATNVVKAMVTIDYTVMKAGSAIDSPPDALSEWTPPAGAVPLAEVTGPSTTQPTTRTVSRRLSRK